jgi:cobalamin biosynthesis protein CobT
VKRLVLFVEGDGEAEAAPKLVKRLLTEQNAWDAVLLDEAPFRVGHVNKLMKDDFRDWMRKLRACQKRKNVGGVLLLLDGDVRVGRKDFCAFAVARSLAEAAIRVGAGETFSVAIVFARQEYESWLIAGIASLAGRRLSDARLINPDATAPLGDLEENLRNAKAWLGGIVEGGYKPTRDQAGFTEIVDLNIIRQRKLRSFRRLESALSNLISAFRDNKPIATPC